MGDPGSKKINVEADEESAHPGPGEVIAGKYRIDKLVGRGGMGVVLAAQHVALGQSVAIKLLTVEGLDEARRREAAARFLREGQSAARLTSDHVVRIYDVGTMDSGAPFMVMELLRGEDLATLLERQGPAPVEVAVEYVVQACDAVAEAHATGIVHRDLKPSNLFVSRRSDGRPLVKVLDFGISKAIVPGGDTFEGGLTATRSVVGSPYYMSPEQVRDAKRVDARTDIWSMGMILYELMTGEPAFNADTLPGICAAIAADDPAPIREHRPDVPPEVEAIVMRCLEKDPAKRFQSVTEFVKALAPFVPHSAASSALYASRPSAAVDSLDHPKFSPDAETIGVSVPGSGPRRSVHDPAAYAITDPPDFGPNTAASALDIIPTTPPNQKVESGSKSDVAVATLVSPSGRTGVSPPPAKWTRVAVIGGAVVLGALALVLVSSKKEPNMEAPRVTAPAPSRFTLAVESTPAGASVLDGDRVIGTTPFTTVIDNAAVQNAPRKLTIRLDGYEPYEIVQGPSNGNVRASAGLMPLRQGAPSAAPPPAPPAAPQTASPRPRQAPAKNPPHHVPSSPPPAAPDIRLER